MEQVTFHSMQLNKLLHLEEERVRDIGGGRSTVVKAKMVKFENGVYSTFDQGEMELIRLTPAYQKKEVFEVSQTDVSAVEEAQRAEKQRTIRGAITSQTIAQEAGVETPQKTGLKLSEKNTTTCDVCGKAFEDDLGGKRLRMHKIGAHRDKKIEG